MLREFRDFAFKGNLVELAVAFILGVAFATLVTATVDNILTPIIAAIFGQPDFSSLHFTINKSAFTYGAWLNAVIAFLLTAFVLFLVVKAYNRRKQPESPAPVRECPFCKTTIPEAATRCPACTSDVGVARGA
ncbi:MAG: large conductance mechanosensitive channel protein MscL [Actinomycetota bacterium]